METVTLSKAQFQQALELGIYANPQEVGQQLYRVVYYPAHLQFTRIEIVKVW